MEFLICTLKLLSNDISVCNAQILSPEARCNWQFTCSWLFLSIMPSSLTFQVKSGLHRVNVAETNPTWEGVATSRRRSTGSSWVQMWRLPDGAYSGTNSQARTCNMQIQIQKLSYVHKDLKRLGVYLWVLLSKLFIIGQMKWPNIVRKGSDALQNFFWFFPGWSIFMRRLFTERQFGWFLLRVRASKYRTAGSRAHVRSRA